MEEKFRLGSVDIYVNENHRFGTDAVLLADFASPFPSETVCDLCTGCGIIPLFFCRSKPPKKVYGVELQREAAELFGKSVRENGLEDVLFPIEVDLTDTKALLEHIPRGSADMVTVNPPYYKENSGKTRLTEAQRIARHEIACDLEQVIEASDLLLKYGGSLKMCHLPERTAKKLTVVCNKAGEKPWLALISGKKGGKVGLDIDKPLIMREENGNYTKRLLEIYGMQY